MPERRLTRGAPAASWGRRMLALALVSSMAALGVVVAAPPVVVPQAAAVPGVPADPATIYLENFDNRPGSTPIARLNEYVGATGQTYTASAPWLTNCNGWIAQYNQPTTAAGGATTQVSDCRGQLSWNATQQLAQALGIFDGQTTAAARSNFAVSAFTAGNPGANNVEFQTTSNIPLPTTTGRYLTAQLDVAAVNCPPAASAPTLQFQLIDNAGGATTIGGTINACTAPDARTIQTEPLGAAGPANVRVGTTSSNGSLLWNSPTLGLRIINTNGSGAGNDHAFDNIRIVDATPQLDKEFIPTTVGVGQPTTIRFTITNTSELASKNGWSFTDNLPAGMVVASPNAATSTCGAPQITAPVGGTTIAMQGNLTAGTASCTVSVNAVAAQTGTFTNGPANINPLVGLNPPPAPGPSAQVVDTDFGDAPASYGTASTSHTAAAGLTLGTARDSEGAAVVSASALGDDNDRTADEDAVPAGLAVRPDQPMSVPASVRNTTGAPATLVGWIDFNRDGDFSDPGEQSALITVPAGATSVTATWAAVTGAGAGASFARFRLYPGTVGAPAPTGAATGGEVEDLAITLQQPSVSLDKTAGAVNDVDGNGTDAGDTLTYTFAVTNTGNVPLAPIAVNDPLLGGAVACGSGSLAAGATRTCPTVTYVLTQADVDAGVRANSATVTATPPSGPDVSGNDSTSTTLDPASELSLTKIAAWDDADSDDEIDVGETITYSFRVTNTGAVTITDLAVTDPTLTAEGITISCPVATLAPGDATTCTGSGAYVIDQDDVDANTVTNTAEATGDDPGGNQVTSDPSSTTTPGIPAPGIELRKTATVNPAAHQGAAEAGDTITYGFVVTNTGNQTLTDVSVSDPDLGNTLTCTPTRIAPGADSTCTSTATYTVTQADVNAQNPIVNTATASAVPPGGGTVTDTDTATIQVDPADPSLALDKEAGTPADVNGNGITDAGDSLTYTFTVENTGNVTITNLSVDDPLLDGATPPVPVTCLAATLDPTDVTTCTATYIVTAGDETAGTVDNAATATGEDPQGDSIDSNQDRTSTPVQAADADLRLVKTAGDVVDVDGSGNNSAGDTITYTFTVTNTGNVTIDDLVIEDDLLANATPAVAVACDVTTLGPADVATCTATYAVTLADVEAGGVDNEATATGTYDGDDVTSDPDTTSTTLTRAPALRLTKVADWDDTDSDGAIDVGEEITYSFLLENTGNVTVDTLAVDDDLLDAASIAIGCTQVSLAPGASTTCTAADPYVVTQADVDAGTVENTARVTGTGPAGGPVTSNEGSTTTPGALTPALVLDKTATVAPASRQNAAAAGDTITYTFTVTNTGNVTLNAVTVSDPQLTALGGIITCAPTRLTPGQVAECTSSVTRTVTQADVDAATALTNTATAAGLPPNGAPVTSTDTATVPIAPAAPALTLVKTAGDVVDVDKSGDDTPGDTIRYMFTVTNTGNVTLSKVVVNDPLLAGATPAVAIACANTSLTPRQVTTCAADYPLSQADIDAGKVENTATATGSNGNTPTTSPASSTGSPLEQEPGLEMVKTGRLDDADGDGLADKGETIVYTFKVTNTGNVSVTKLGIDDPMLEDANIGVDCADKRLAPGEATTCTARTGYAVTGADVKAGDVTNVAEAVAQTPVGQVDVTSPEDEVTVPTDIADTTDQNNGGGNGGETSPEPTDTNGMLPDTGGPALWTSLLAVMLVSLGGYLVARSRRRIT